MKIKELLEAIGPHNNQELNLMLTSAKPSALLYKEEFSTAWREAARKHGWIVKPFEGFGKQQGYIIAKQAATANSIAQLFSQAVSNGVSTRFHIELGRLLGYTNVDIAHFLASSTAQRLLGPVLSTVQAAARIAGGITGIGATLATHSTGLNSGEEEELARRRSMPPTIR
jgi:hypothetical protein